MQIAGAVGSLGRSDRQKYSIIVEIWGMYPFLVIQMDNEFKG